MIRRKAYPLGFVIALFGLPVVAGELDAFVSARDGAANCWSRVYDNTHLGAHPQQTVTGMRFGVGYYGKTEQHPAGYWFTLESDQRGGISGTASGSCGAADDKMWCGVDCDGGGVLVSKNSDGTVLLDLADSGSIRMSSTCGTDSEDEGFQLEAGIDDKEFLLRPLSGAECKALRPDWL